MNHLVLAALLAVATASYAGVSHTSASDTIELQVEGLNCALCSEAMKADLKRVAGATDIEPKLECGRIYLQVAPGATLNEGAINMTLLANGFNLKSLQPSAQALSLVRARKEC